MKLAAIERERLLQAEEEEEKEMEEKGRVSKNIPFFTPSGFQFFLQYAGTKYRRDNPEHPAAGKRIREEIFEKTNAWAKLLNLDGWEFKLDHMWQLSGRFKPYSWARILKPENRKEKIFFTLGVDGEKKALVYKLDCQRSRHTSENALTKEQVTAFDRLRSGTGAECNQISFDELGEYDWEGLRQLTIDFIGRYEFLYDEAIKAVGTTTVIQTTEVGKEDGESLVEFPIPTDLFDELPEKKYSFKGTVIDYDAENKNAKIIGDGGEKLVIAREKKILKANRLDKLAEEVKKSKDGEGYDVLSFDLKGNKKFIEVKTTTGIGARPFIMTDNEWEFMKRHPDQYHLYRIYDYDKDAKKGKVFCLSGNIEEKVFTRQKQIEVFLKTNCNE